MKKLVVFTGAGVSADSGLATFRDSDGTWGNYRIEEVCIPEALDFNRRGVIRFYNERRAEMLKAEPNAAHRAIAGLERDFDVRVITQNVDNLHERAGSTHILHLHGELTKLRSTDDPSLILPFDGVEQGFDDRAPDGSLLRPHIVFFGEPVPEFDRAAELAAGADILMVVGTSLAVYPAASLVRCVRPDIPVYVVDPGRPAIRGVRNPLEVIRKRAAEGVPELADRLRAACAGRAVRIAFARKSLIRPSRRFPASGPSRFALRSRFPAFGPPSVFRFPFPAFPGRTLRFRLALARIHSYSDPAHSISGPFRTASSGRALRPITRLHVCPFRVTMRLCNAVGFGPVGVPAAVPA